jgi:hypothetical protein
MASCEGDREALDGTRLSFSPAGRLARTDKRIPGRLVGHFFARRVSPPAPVCGLIL